MQRLAQNSTQIILQSHQAQCHSKSILFEGQVKDFVTVPIDICNSFQHSIAFRIRTTIQEKHAVKPNKWLLGPLESHVIKGKRAPIFRN